ncbi:hypothetical protein [Pseudomonas sp. Marseille-Q5115]|uniref:hypothetical protein n=1 Tax=Pseudomonas sp. Marseille-Q5115 TaxID=2866593 RepID=UPI001CE476A7|nr:hypothetical protein [Pseudomonas sp. Marseille-Q5115]
MALFELIPSATVENTTFTGAVICVLIRIILQWCHGLKINTSLCVTAFFNGTSVVPFGLIAGCISYPDWIQVVMESKLSMAIAGGVGMFFVLGEVFRPSDLRKKAQETGQPHPQGKLRT